MATLTGKVKTKGATVSAVVIRKDGTRQDLGEIAGKRSLWQWLRAKWLRRKMLKQEKKRAQGRK